MAVEAGLWVYKGHESQKMNPLAPENVCLSLTVIIHGPLYNYVCWRACLEARAAREETFVACLLLSVWWPISSAVNIGTLWRAIDWRQQSNGDNDNDKDN